MAEDKRTKIPTALCVPPTHLIRVDTARGRLRYYEHPFTMVTVNRNGVDMKEKEQYPSVTSILGETVNKPFLTYWRDGRTRSTLKAHLGEVLSEQIINDAMNSSKKEAANGAELGSILHDAIDGYLKGDESAMDVPDQLMPAAMAFMDWRSENSDWKYLESETAVFYKGELKYAGTIDALFEDRKGNLIIVDWKTSSDVYNDNLMQLAAYSRALRKMTEQPVIAQVVQFKNKRDKTIAERPKIFFEEFPKVVTVDQSKWVEQFDHAHHLYDGSNIEIVEDVA